MIGWIHPMMVGLAHYRLKDYPKAIEQLSIAATEEKAPYPNVAQHTYVSDFKSFAWFYLAMAQLRDGQKAKADESFARGEAEGSEELFDRRAREEAMATFRK